MASRFSFNSKNAVERPSQDGASVIRVVSAGQRLRSMLEFEGSTEQTASFTEVAPVGLSPNLTATFFYTMASAEAGDARWRIELEAITPNVDAVDLHAEHAFDAPNDAPAVAAPSVAGHLASVSVEITNGASVEVGDLLRFRVTYLEASTAPGNALLSHVEISDAA